MTIEDWVKIIGAITPLLAALITGFVAIYLKISEVHHQINSRMDELVEATRREAHAEGMIAGAAQPKVE